MATLDGFTPTIQELRRLQNMRAEYESDVRAYAMFDSVREMKRYNERFHGQWFSDDNMAFFSSKIGAFYHGASPANWNIFVSSERNKYSNDPRKYTVRQVQIDGSVEELSQFGEFTSSAQAKRFIARYLKANEV